MEPVEIVNSQGSVLVGGGIIYQPRAGYKGVLTQIDFSNTTGSAYIITLSMYRVVPNTTTQIYSFSLAAGDVLTDTGKYHLADGDYLYAITNDADTVYVTNGSDIINENPV
jgi:hypothetical protein